MKNITKTLTIAIVIGILSLMLIACGPKVVAAETTTSRNGETASLARGGGRRNAARADDNSGATIDDAASKGTLDRAPTGALSDAESEGILYMREEEKLARDVYLVLYEKWGLPIFDNIASSEDTHMSAVRTLIDRYGLEDPVAGKGIGEFENDELQALYDALVEQGNRSLEDALRVGAAIEEIDILDLQEHIAQTDQADIQRVYENLMRGSRNHLRSFVSTLEKRGQTYQPSSLSPEAF